MLKNVFQEVKDDAVSEARAGDPRLTSSAASFSATTGQDAGASPEFSIPVTFPTAAGTSLGPFIVDETPVDDPNAYLG